MSKTSTNKLPLNPPKTSKLFNQNSKMTPTQQPSTINNTNLINDNFTQKTFAKTTANQTFQKKKFKLLFLTQSTAFQKFNTPKLSIW